MGTSQVSLVQHYLLVLHTGQTRLFGSRLWCHLHHLSESSMVPTLPRKTLSWTTICSLNSFVATLDKSIPILDEDFFKTVGVTSYAIALKKMKQLVAAEEHTGLQSQTWRVWNRRFCDFFLHSTQDFNFTDLELSTMRIYFTGKMKASYTASLLFHLCPRQGTFHPETGHFRFYQSLTTLWQCLEPVHVPCTVLRGPV